MGDLFKPGYVKLPHFVFRLNCKFESILSGKSFKIYLVKPLYSKAKEDGETKIKTTPINTNTLFKFIFCLKPFFTFFITFS